MLRYLIAFAVAAITIAAPAAAQQLWRHEASGISLPREVGEMRLREERDASGGGRYDVILQYGEGPTAVTIYVYRSAYPNPALWFERTRMAMNINVGSPSENVAPDSFTLGNAPAPNGLREDIAIPGGGRYRATSVAIAQVGEWIVKLRVTSQSLDRAGVAARMSQLLGALRFERMPAPHPLVVPSPCAEESEMDGTPMRGDRERDVAVATVAGVGALQEARGRSGLAANPAEWCRAASELPMNLATVYRRRSGDGWVVLLGDSGLAVSAQALARFGGSGAATYSSTAASTRLVELYQRLPDPVAAVDAAVPVLVGQSQGLAEIRAD